VAQVAATKPDVLLLDWNLPEEPMLDLLAQLGQADPRPQIVVMSVRAEVEQEALAAGADAFVKKNVPPLDLLAVLDSLSAEDKTETNDEFDPV
jgi:DNA-binding NarL/FixJ family response regulator